MVDVTLHLGDCLEWLPTLPAQSVDLIATDLPYGTTACAWDTIIPLEPMWNEVRRILKPNGIFITTACQPFTSRLVMSNIEWFKYEWIWKKTRISGHLNANKRPLRAHENIIVFGGGLYNPQMTAGKVHERGNKQKWYKDTGAYGCFERGRATTLSHLWYPQTILEYPADPETTVTFAHRPNRIDVHPTQKPLKLYKYLVNTYSNPGDLVCDFCFESGTTAIAAIQTGRNFIGCELQADYFAIAERRIKAAQAQLLLPGIG